MRKEKEERERGTDVVQLSAERGELKEREREGGERPNWEERDGGAAGERGDEVEEVHAVQNLCCEAHRLGSKSVLCP